MNKINRKVEYALMALKHLSSKVPGELASAKEISLAYGAPFDATSRVLQIMGQNGILKAEQGPSGGYMIVRDLNKISFYELTEMLLGPMGVAKCLHQTCELINTCNIVTPVAVLNDRMAEFYRSVTLRELIDPSSKPSEMVKEAL